MSHAMFGGSNADRWLNCPGSTGLNQQVPKRPAGMAALTGTAQHRVMELLLTNPELLPESFLGAVVESVELEQDDIDAITLALEAFETLESEYPDSQIYSEHRVDLTEDAWGTADILFVQSHHLVCADFKFGQGVVDAKDNEQGLFYAAAARKTLKVDPKTIEVVIIQPAMDPAMDRHMYTKAELDRFEAQCMLALKVAQDPVPTYAEGDWCKWCNAKLVCPLKTQRLDTLTAPNHILNLDELGERVVKIRSWLKWLEEAEERLHHELEHGTAIKGWKLVAKRGVRQWRSEAEAALSLGIPENKLYVRKIISPAQADKLTDKKLVAELSTTISSGTTIAPSDDKRPEILSTVALGRVLNALQ